MTINCKGALIDLEVAKVMGILNLTPDSFYDGGRYTDPSSILKKVESMLSQGATFIDIGAYSSRPGAATVSEDIELARITPIVELILKEFPETLISIDSFRAKAAKECIAAGAAIINDISAGTLDKKMMPLIGKLQVPYIMMHLKGSFSTMHTATNYTNITKEVISYFSEKIQLARSYKIIDLIIDPGFGFSKNLDQNFELLSSFDALSNLKLPVLAGLSRKSMIYKTLNTSAEHALNGTTALHMTALRKGAKILRVHDVKEAVECITLHNMLTD